MRTLFKFMHVARTLIQFEMLHELLFAQASLFKLYSEH